MNSSGYPQSYEDGNGTLIGIKSAADGVYLFEDDSQRILRQTSADRYILENPDYSTEKYGKYGEILSVSDKYGEEYLSYGYINRRLYSVKYRGNKVIKLFYDSYLKLDHIEYCAANKSFTVNFTYSNGGITIAHYSGMDYNLKLENELFTVSSVANGENYSAIHSQKLSARIFFTEADNPLKARKALTVIKTIGISDVDWVTYTFFNDFYDKEKNKFKAVNITNRNNLTTRVQYENYNPSYTY